MRNLKLIIISFSLSNHALRILELQQVVFDAFGIKMSHGWGWEWSRSRRHLFKKRKAKLMTQARDSEVMIIEAEDFCDAIEEVQQYYLFAAHNIINADETRIVIGKDKVDVLETVMKNRLGTHGTRPKAICTLLSFFKADGSVLMSVYCLRGRMEDPNTSPTLLKVASYIPKEDRLQRGHWPCFYTTTETGYLNKGTWEQVFLELVAEWTKTHPGLHCFVFVDNLNIHISPEVAAWGLEAGVFVLFLVRNATHLLQPADSYPFAALKQQISVRCRQALRDAAFQPENRTPALWSEVYEAERSSFSRSSIIAAFKETGLFPWDRKRIMAMVRSNVAGILEKQLNEHETEIVQQITQVIRSKEKRTANRAKKVTSVTALVEKNRIYTPWQSIQQTDELRIKRSEQATNQLKRKRQRKGSSSSRDAWQRKLICAWDSCNVRHHFSTKWAVCERCADRYCPAHKRGIESHTCPAT